MKQEEAIEKIKKLLRLSESPNQNEAQVALKKARALMLQYHITESSLDTQEKTVIWKEVPINKNWMTTFYSLISRNNRCDFYYSEGYHSVNGKFKKVRTAHIVGFPFDIECVIVMAQLVEDTIKRGISEFRRNIRIESSLSTKGVTNNYVWGFRDGLQKAFDEQNAKQEFHLMCITPKEVKDEMDAVENLKRVKHTIRLGQSLNEVKAFMKGNTEGYETGMRKQLEVAL